jgi:hypothetical protein
LFYFLNLKSVMVMFYSIEESLIPLYADAYLVDGNNRCLWVSLWASEAAVQEFFARLTLPNHEFGLDRFTLMRRGKEPTKERTEEQTEGRFEQQVISAAQAKNLQKFTAKTPASGILGALCHVWIYAPEVRELDRSGGNGYLLQLKDETPKQFELRAWAMVKELSQIPLLDEWSDLLMEKIRAQAGITELKGSGVTGFHIHIDQDVLVELVQNGLREGWLKVPCVRSKEAASVVDGIKACVGVDRKRGQLDLLI